MATTLKCKECPSPARWHVWYKGVSLPIGSGTFAGNIAYNSFCNEHAFQEMRDGREGWHVECVKLVPDQFLPGGDRALSKPLHEKPNG